MTQEEAREIIYKYHCLNDMSVCGRQLAQAFDVAIKVLAPLESNEINKAAVDWYEKEAYPKSSMWIDGTQYQFAEFKRAFEAGVKMKESCH